MLGWPDALCRALADAGHFVIRFDHRDTGQSTSCPAGAPDYHVEDMAQDALAILDAYGIGAAHLVGMSLGAYLAQMLCVSAPARVTSVTLIAAEPLGWDGAPLPHISDAFLSHFAALADLDWGDNVAVADYLLEIERLCAGPVLPFDAAQARLRIAEIMARAANLPSMFNHGALATRQDWTGAFRKISVPALVIHGGQDPILPPANGQALAEGIPDATFALLAPVGHALPQSHIAQISAMIAAHVAKAEV